MTTGELLQQTFGLTLIALCLGGCGRAPAEPTATPTNEAPHRLDTTVVASTDVPPEPTGTPVLTDSSVYTATVTSPDDSVGGPTNGITVEQAIGVWATGGPYGGQIRDLVISPATSQTVWAAVTGAGSFRTVNGGNQWELAVPDPAANGVGYSSASPHALYHWGGGLHRSDDDGLNWQELHSGSIRAFALDPQDENTLWIVDGGEVRRSYNRKLWIAKLGKAAYPWGYQMPKSDCTSRRKDTPCSSLPQMTSKEKL